MRFKRILQRILLFSLILFFIFQISYYIGNYKDESDVLFSVSCPNWNKSIIGTPSETSSISKSFLYPERCFEYLNLAYLIKRNGATVHRYCSSHVLMEPILRTKRDFLIVGVLSSPQSREMRDAVRETWASRSLLSHLNRYVNAIIIALFVRGDFKK